MSLTKFFQPRDEFFTWLKGYANGRIVFDVGCGQGHILKAMWQHGIKGIGIDIRLYDDVEDVDIRSRSLHGNATTITCLRTMPGIAMFCRPSHTGWVWETIVHNLHPDTEAIYISLPCNLHEDLVDIPVKRLDAPGMEQEWAWSVVRPLPAELRSRTVGGPRGIHMLNALWGR